MSIEIVVDPRTIQWPCNPITGRDYARGNASRLIELMSEQGWPSGEFATFVQWRNGGRIVRRGERGATCLLPTVTRSDDDLEIVSGKVRHCFVVFALEQTDPMGTDPTSELP